MFNSVIQLNKITHFKVMELCSLTLYVNGVLPLSFKPNFLSIHYELLQVLTKKPTVLLTFC